MKTILFFLFAAIFSLKMFSLDLVIVSNNLLKIDSPALLANKIYSAAFNDVSPGFDDLYIIKTQDKDREIIIYCNADFCYKNYNNIMIS